jgi:eukaryotic-like serine/threonine-protein kinase
LVTAYIEKANHQTTILLDNDAAVASTEKALSISASRPKRNDSEIVTMYSNIATMRQQQGRLTEAGDAFARAAEMASRTVGPNARIAWLPAMNAARTAHLAGQREVAHQRFGASLLNLPKVGTNTDATVTYMHYGERLASEGRASDAIPILRDCAEALDREAAYPFQPLLVRRFLGEAYLASGQLELAQATLKESLMGYEKLLEGDPSLQPLLAARESYGRVLFAIGDLDGALAQYGEVIARADGRKLSHIALAHAGRAEALAKRSDGVNALAASQTALDIWKQRTGFYDVRMEARILRAHADALVVSGDVDSARRVEAEAVELSKRYDHPTSRTTVARMFSAATQR